MSRLDRLIELRDVLESAIAECDSKRDLASLARQYRETLREIEEIEGADANDDEIAEILSDRKTDGKAGAVRKSRS
jgi:hypothetical protein